MSVPSVRPTKDRMSIDEDGPLELSPDARVDLFAIRKTLLEGLGPRAFDYWKTLKNLIAAKLSKTELDAQFSSVLTNPRLIVLHNQLIAGIIHNSRSASYPPSAVPLPPNATGAIPPPTTTSSTSSRASTLKRNASSRPPITPRGSASSLLLGGPAPLAERADLMRRGAGSKLPQLSHTDPHSLASAALTPRSAGRRNDKKKGSAAAAALANVTEVSGRETGPILRPGVVGRHYRTSSNILVQDAKRQRIEAGDVDSEVDIADPARYLPDFGTLRAHMNKIGRLNEIEEVSDDTVLLLMHSLEAYLKDIIAKASSLKRPPRPLLIHNADGTTTETTSEHVITSTDLRTAVELNPPVLGESDTYSRERISLKLSQDGA